MSCLILESQLPYNWKSSSQYYSYVFYHSCMYENDKVETTMSIKDNITPFYVNSSYDGYNFLYVHSFQYKNNTTIKHTKLYIWKCIKQNFNSFEFFVYEIQEDPVILSLPTIRFTTIDYSITNFFEEISFPSISIYHRKIYCITKDGINPIYSFEKTIPDYINDTSYECVNIENSGNKELYYIKLIYQHYHMKTIKIEYHKKIDCGNITTFNELFADFLRIKYFP